MSPCPFCSGTGKVDRVRNGGVTRYRVTCPVCVRHVKVLGTHEMLRAADGQVYDRTAYAEFDLEGLDD